ncbi:MAG: glycosyltransferase family 2 protein [Myxococcota bacterium]|jgi:hypothetical protein|nr:glycosyltransferase family 2 protein [Myxococcota bacterium]
MNIVITMAGRGERFRRAGYDVPKYQVTVRGEPLFCWALDSLRNFTSHVDAHVIFLTREEDAAAPFVHEQCRRLGIGRHDIVELSKTTDGQATTVLAAEPAIEHPDRPLLIYNIDTHVDPRVLTLASVCGHGWIPCFPGAGDAWSFVRLGPDGWALEVREKQRVSAHATVGLYWFSSFTLYQDVYRVHYTDPTHFECGERYVAPLYNEVIRRGLRVAIHAMPLGAVQPLGTPAEVAALEAGGHACAPVMAAGPAC